MNVFVVILRRIFKRKLSIAERKEIIKKLKIKSGILKCIIGLPANLFYGTGIAACILVLDKESAFQRKTIFMIDASKDFIKHGPKNQLREQDIHKIIDIFSRFLNFFI